MNKKRRFLEMFNFLNSKRGYIGIEMERFLVDGTGRLVPRAHEFLKRIRGVDWSPELSACQVEDKTSPGKDLQSIWHKLANNDYVGSITAKKMGVHLITWPVAPSDMPLDIYPSQRYRKIVERISSDKLRAACRVIGLHIHIGMSGWKEAILVYNSLVRNLGFLCKVGDHSKGERLRLYKIMAEDWSPPEIKDPEHFFQIAETQGFDQDPRNCYWLVRISPHGTVELRMFDMTENLFEILGLIVVVRAIVGVGG